MNIIINAFGIIDSGGLKVFDKMLREISIETQCRYHIFCNNNEGVLSLQKKYYSNRNLQFITVLNKGFVHRLCYEFFYFKRVIKNRNIQLIYNFTGSYQFFVGIPQVVKVQNLLFFSKRLDFSYANKKKLFLWFKQIYIKRIFFKFVLSRSKYIEIQSKHVKSCLSDFVDIKNKIFFLKSDIDTSDALFHKPKQYDFSNKVNFLYIVGPHFEYVHKNFIDFTRAMVRLSKEKIDFEINITLTKDQLNESELWDQRLNSRTNFLGYIKENKKINDLFCDNTILISSSIIETLGLHVIEGIKNGIIVIAPDEDYVSSVYGGGVFRYELFNSISLLKTIKGVLDCKNKYDKRIVESQHDLKEKEKEKYSNITEIFNKIS